MTALPAFELSWLAYIGVFVGVLVAFEGLRQILSRSESLGEASSRRMRMIAAGTSTEDRLRLLKPAESRWALSALPFVGTLPKDLAHAGMTISPGNALAAMLGGAAILACALSLVAPLQIAIGAALFLAVILPSSALRIRAKKRLDALSRQLPDALDLMARGLSVGHPLNVTIGSVATDMRDPIATEFGIMVDQVSYGDDLVDAFDALADRIGTEDVRYLAVSVGIQHGTGGNLAGILKTLATVIRDRMTMRKRIKAISAEGRLTSMFLTSVPFIMLTAVMIMSPDYYMGVIDDPIFRPLSLVIIALIIANGLILRRLVNFRF